MTMTSCVRCIPRVKGHGRRGFTSAPAPAEIELDASPPLKILVTGAGGLIGGELCGRLIDRGHGVVGLVHRSPSITRNDGRPLACLPWSAMPPRPGEMSWIGGDVRRAGLGLPEGAVEVDLIVHCAAVTRFDLPSETYQAINVDGAAHMANLALAARDPPGVVHVSTAYVCGDRSGPIPEAPQAGYGPFSNLYESSKAEAETVMASAASRGLRVAIARPSIVVGASDSGAIGRFDQVYALMKLVAEGRIGVLPATPDATLDLVPIDHVVAGLIDIVERFDAARGRVFHLVSGAPTPITAFAALGDHFPQLRPARFVDPGVFEVSTLRPSQRLAFQRAAALCVGYLRRDPRFADDNLRVLSGRSCPPLGAAFLHRMLRYAMAKGYIRPRPQRTSG